MGLRVAQGWGQGLIALPEPTPTVDETEGEEVVWVRWLGFGLETREGALAYKAWVGDGAGTRREGGRGGGGVSTCAWWQGRGVSKSSSLKLQSQP